MLGLGTVAGARAGQASDVRRWTTVALVSDSPDVVAGVPGRRAIGTANPLAATIAALLAVSGGIRTLRYGPGVADWASSGPDCADFTAHVQRPPPSDAADGGRSPTSMEFVCRCRLPSRRVGPRAIQPRRRRHGQGRRSRFMARQRHRQDEVTVVTVVLVTHNMFQASTAPVTPARHRDLLTISGRGSRHSAPVRMPSPPADQMS